jgi:hypothetical protein
MFPLSWQHFTPRGFLIMRAEYGIAESQRRDVLRFGPEAADATKNRVPGNEKKNHRIS